jgi:hypothetical protein
MEVPECPVVPSVHKIEHKLLRLVQPATLGMVSSQAALAKNKLPLLSSPIHWHLQVGAYPLQSLGNTPLEAEMHKELEASWEAHYNNPAAAAVTPDALNRIKHMQVGPRC